MAMVFISAVKVSWREGQRLE